MEEPGVELPAVPVAVVGLVLEVGEVLVPAEVDAPAAVEDGVTGCPV